MTYKTPIIYIKLFFIFFLCLSCKGNDKNNSEPLISSLEMTPSDSIFPKLTESYINSKKNKIERFFNKNWPSKNNNISFLVAKDGQIIYENYSGFGDVRKKTPITTQPTQQFSSRRSSKQTSFSQSQKKWGTL